MKIFSDSQLVVNQVNDIYLARGEKIGAYLDKAKEQLSSFFAASIEVIPRNKNSNIHAFAKLASTRDVDVLDAVSVEFLAEPSIHPQQGGNGTNTRTIMDRPHRRVPEHLRAAQGQDRSSNLSTESSSLRTLWRQALQERLLHTIPKVCHSFKSEIYLEENS